MGFDYSLSIENNSGKTHDFCVYQKHPKLSQDAISLAWFVKTIHDRDHAEAPTGLDSADFEWNENYSFTWDETGVLNDLVRFHASGNWPADRHATKTPATKTRAGNQVGLAKVGGAYTFTEPIPVRDVDDGSLGIFADKSVEIDKVSVSLAMYGSPFFALQTGPNLQHIITPQPEYWVVAVNGEQGQSVKAVTSGQPLKIDFSLSPRAKVLYSKDNTFTQLSSAASPLVAEAT